MIEIDIEITEAITEHDLCVLVERFGGRWTEATTAKDAKGNVIPVHPEGDLSDEQGVYAIVDTYSPKELTVHVGGKNGERSLEIATQFAAEAVALWGGKASMYEEDLSLPHSVI